MRRSFLVSFLLGFCATGLVLRTLSAPASASSCADTGTDGSGAYVLVGFEATTSNGEVPFEDDAWPFRLVGWLPLEADPKAERVVLHDLDGGPALVLREE